MATLNRVSFTPDLETRASIVLDTMPGLGPRALQTLLRTHRTAAGVLEAARRNRISPRVDVSTGRAAIATGCQVPVGARAQTWGEELVLRALVATADGTNVIRAEGRDGLSNATALGKRVAEDLLARGGGAIVEQYREDG